MKTKICKTGSAVPGESEERELVAAMNDAALWRTVREFGMTLPPHSIGAWRATQRNPGTIDGVTVGDVKVLLTDGIVAWFVADDGTLLHGHVSHFSGEVKPMFSVKKKSTAGAKSTRKEGVRPLRVPRLSALDKALAVLQSMTKG